MTAAAVVDALDTADLSFVSEDDLQAEILAVLTSAGLLAQREFHLSDGRSRIDLYTEDAVGIEVKVDGSWPDVVRQLTRYAKCPEISELVLVTTRVKHHRIPSVLEGKPIHLVSLIGAAL